MIELYLIFCLTDRYLITFKPCFWIKEVDFRKDKNLIRDSKAVYSFPFSKIIYVNQWHGCTEYQCPHTGIDFASIRENIYASDDGIVAAKGRENTEESDSKKDLKYARELDIEKLQDQLDAFSLSQESSWDILLMSEFTYGYTPLEIWILKEQLAYVDYLFASQRSDDMQVDKEEWEKLITQISNLLTEDIYEKAKKELRFKEEDLSNSSKVKKLILVAFVLHTHDMPRDALKELSKVLILQSFDRFWMEHLDNMTDLREGISLRNLAQRDPLVEYKNEGFEMFNRMFDSINQSVRDRFFKVRVVRRDMPELPRNIKTQKPELTQRDNRPGEVSKQKTVRKSIKVGRNDPCPCGSGKKYKNCCYPKYE